MSSISLCMIVKNESHNLPRCIDSAKDLVDEIIIVDTGSEDNTVEIARSYGAKVSFFAWCDDFAAARNYSLSLATSDWILVLDADEQLVIHKSSDRQSIHKFLDNELSTQTDGYTVQIEDIDHGHFIAPCILRLFRNSPNIKYIGVFHENPSCQVVKYLDQFSILHHGYNPELMKEKCIRRNIPILEKAHQEGRLEISLLICLEGMYEAYNYDEKADKCSEEIWEYLLPYILSSAIPPHISYVPEFLFRYGSKALRLNDLDTACLIAQYNEAHPANYPPLIYLTGEILKAMGFSWGATVYYQKCLQIHNESFALDGIFDKAYITTYPAYELGRIYYEKGEIQAAINSLQLALEFKPDFAQVIEYLQKLK